MDMARFFLASTGPHQLRDAPGGAAYLTDGAATLERGKVVFAETCARCHSSKLPPLPAGLDMENCNGRNYLDCWSRYWAWSKTPQFKDQMRTIVLANDFLNDNYLSTELRIPSTLMQTNICSPIATNAIAGNIWDNFSSASYKALPSVGTMKVRDPLTGAERDFKLPGGGRGFTRPASLVSVWSTAPFLQNNTVGPFNPSPSVEARMRVFEASIEQMLWPEKRPKDPIFANDSGPGVGIIDRTTADSSIWVPSGYVPDALRGLVGIGERLFPFLVRNGSVELGPIPKGTPVGGIPNLDVLNLADPPELRRVHLKKVADLLILAKKELKQGHNIYANQEVLGRMLELSKCPDYVVNKGHYFGTSLQTEEAPLSDADKRALVALIKTF